MSARRIVIAGAGIGGLTAALALARGGHDVILVERAGELREAGAGLQVSPNASRVLGRLGVLERIGADAVAPEALNIWRARDGARLARLPLGAAAAARWGAPFLVARRADLQRALLAGAAEAGVAPRLGCAVESFATAGAKVEIALREGGALLALTADALIGADGLHSIVREKLGAPPPRFLRRVAWRALVPAAAAPGFARDAQSHLWLGAKAHLVHYPVAGGRLINLVAVVAGGRGAYRDDDRFWSQDGAFPLERFAGWSAGARALVAAGADWRCWPLFDHPPLARWSRDGVALLGDAAHAMAPFLAQGAAQAIEDAACLASVLAQGEIAPALARYSAVRAARAARVQAQSRQQGMIYHLAGPAALARDLVLGALGPARQDWLYGHDAGLC